jgi:hypothetical protein
MNYLEAFLQKKRRAEKREAPADKTDRTGFVSFVSDSPVCLSMPFHQSGSVSKAPTFAPGVAVTPNSRSPLVSRGVRSVIEAIEADARAKGWSVELLWNGGFWDSPRGLAAVLDSEDEIVEVTADYISILKTRHHLLRFRRYAA